MVSYKQTKKLKLHTIGGKITVQDMLLEDYHILCFDKLDTRSCLTNNRKLREFWLDQGKLGRPIPKHRGSSTVLRSRRLSIILPSNLWLLEWLQSLSNPLSLSNSGFICFKSFSKNGYFPFLCDWSYEISLYTSSLYGVWFFSFTGGSWTLLM